MRGRKSKYHFVIYKGDDVVCHGTREECAKFLGWKPHTITNIATKSWLDKYGGNGFVAEKVSIAEVEAEKAK